MFLSLWNERWDENYQYVARINIFIKRNKN